MQAASEQFEIVMARHCLELGDAALMIRSHRADKGDVKLLRRWRRQHLENRGSKARWTTSARAPASAEEIHDGSHLGDHEVVDRPVLATRRRYAGLANQNWAADLLDPACEARVDVKQILIEDEIGLEVLDLRQQDLFRLRVEAGAQPDFARERPQHRL